MPASRYVSRPAVSASIPTRLTASDVYLSRADDQCWLVAADVVEEGQLHIPKLWRAGLYEGIWQNDRSFVLPVTFPVEGSYMDW